MGKRSEQTLPKKIHIWQMNTRKTAQHHSSLGKCKLKLQQDTTSHLGQRQTLETEKTDNIKCWPGTQRHWNARPLLWEGKCYSYHGDGLEVS